MKYFQLSRNRIFPDRLCLRTSFLNQGSIDLMLEDPILINRPTVVTARGARLCRPVEKRQEILPPASA